MLLASSPLLEVPLGEIASVLVTLWTLSSISPTYPVVWALLASPFRDRSSQPLGQSAGAAPTPFFVSCSSQIAAFCCLESRYFENHRCIYLEYVFRCFRCVCRRGGKSSPVSTASWLEAEVPNISF